MSNQYEMSKKWPGNPRENVSCPGCGKEYGAYGRRVCINCQECSKCCTCQNEAVLMEAEIAVPLLLS